MNLLRAAWRDGWQAVRDDWRAYLTLNVLDYGLVLTGMAYVFANRTGIHRPPGNLSNG